MSTSPSLMQTDFFVMIFTFWSNFFSGAGIRFHSQDTTIIFVECVDNTNNATKSIKLHNQWNHEPVTHLNAVGKWASTWIMWYHILYTLIMRPSIEVFICGEMNVMKPLSESQYVTVYVCVRVWLRVQLFHESAHGIHTKYIPLILF